MNAARFQAITGRYAALRIAVVGDFCLDRYLEIDPSKQETSIETGLPVHNVVNVRSQPGGAGTILNNLVALGVGEIWPVGFCGDDAEGFSLRRALQARDGVCLDHFHSTGLRSTFTYCKPLLVESKKSPIELNRLDTKNWTPTPALVEGLMLSGLLSVAEEADAVTVLDQVDVAGTGVVTTRFLEGLRALVDHMPNLPIVGDSRRGLRGWPRVMLKMNAAELAALTGTPPTSSITEISRTAAELARLHQHNVFVSLSERGILGASPTGQVEHVPCHPVRGEIDVVGAGDSVTANLTAALAAGANLREALELANAAASIVVHQLGTTGTASVPQIRELLAV